MDPYDFEDYTGLSCPHCGSPNIEHDIADILFCYDCDKEGFEPFEEEC